MSRASVFTCLVLALSPALSLAAEKVAAPARLSATAIVEKNIAARGGLNAWRAVHSLSWSGMMEAGGGDRPPILGIPGRPRPAPAAAQQAAAQLKLPFVYEMQRPRLSRLEIEFNGETAVQVYDGRQGWKLRPFLNRHEVETFTADELKAAEVQAELDGALVDYAAKGTTIELAGVEAVEGQPAYKLKLTLKNGHVMHEWIDAKSFLEVQIEGTPRRLDGKYHAVSVNLRDYRQVNGLLIPHQFETSVQGVKRTEKIQIEKVVVNPPLEESRFAKPT